MSGASQQSSLYEEHARIRAVAVSHFVRGKCPSTNMKRLLFAFLPESLSGGLRDQLDLASQIIDPSYQAQDDLLTVTTGEVAGTEVLVLDAVFEHVVGGGEHGRSDGQDGFFGAAPCAQAVELSLQVRLFDAHRSPSSADQRGLEPRGTLAHAGGAAFAGAFVAAGAKSGPGAQKAPANAA